jgi:predicted membrane protein
MFNHIIMFLQMHYFICLWLLVLFAIYIGAFFYRTWRHYNQFSSKKQNILFIKALVLAASAVTIVFFMNSAIESNSTSKIMDSISTWSKPVKIKKLVNDEANTDTVPNSSKLRYVVTDNHVYTLRHHNSVITDVKMTSKPTYMTYQYRVLKPSATKFERQYFKFASKSIITLRAGQIKLSKIVTYVDQN